MWLFKKRMPVAAAALEVLRTVEPLPLRLRDRARPFAVHAIGTSRFDTAGRDRLQDAFSRLYADRMPAHPQRLRTASAP